MENSSNEKRQERLLLLFQNYKMFSFMCSLLILLILTAAMEGYHYAHSLLSTFGMVAFVAGGYAACTSKRSLIILLLLATP